MPAFSNGNVETAAVVLEPQIAPQPIPKLF